MKLNLKHHNYYEILYKMNLCKKLIALYMKKQDAVVKDVKWMTPARTIMIE